ncbi:MAG: hypothetical protein ABL917_01920 [Parcubacteria group bacterium]
MKVILAVNHHERGGLRFGRAMEVPSAMLQKGQRIFLVINGHREGVVVDEVDYYEEGVALVHCMMEHPIYRGITARSTESWDDLVTWFQADPNWKQYGVYFETDADLPDGPMDEEVLALLKG